MNWLVEDGAARWRDCWLRTIAAGPLVSALKSGEDHPASECVPLDRKLVSVKFSGLALVLPTLSLGFWGDQRSVRYRAGVFILTWKSFCFSFFRLALDPMVAIDDD